MEAPHQALPAESYDAQWSRLGDYIRFNPGARHRRRLMRALLRGKTFQTVLDAGCGLGEGLMELRRAFPGITRLVGVDFAEDTVRKNRAAMPRFEFEVLDIQRNILNQRFDLVVCSEVIEHLEDRRAAFANLTHMVAPGGYLLVMCPTGKLFATERHFGHVSHPDADELQRLAKDCGLMEERLIQWGFPVYQFLKEVTNVSPEWSIRNFAAGRYGLFKRALNHALYAASFVSFPFRGKGCQLFALFRKPVEDSGL